MKFELRKISHSKSLSEETPAYTAQVQHDGHVRAYRAEMWLREREAATARAWAAIAVLQAEMIAAAHKGRGIHA